MRPEITNNKSGKSSCAYFDLVLFCPKHNFNVVKQQNKVYHVKLGIFLPHLHIKFVRLELRLFSYELNHVNMA